MNRTIARILVPTDFSPASDAAVNCAIEIARQFGASVHLLHVLDDPLVGAVAWGSEVYITSLPAIRDSLIDEAAARLSAVLKRAEQRRVPARSEVRLGRAAEVICEVAKTEGSDLIVMGTHGRTGIAHLLLGSVAEKTVRESERPVLTVRAADRAATKSDVGEDELARTA